MSFHLPDIVLLSCGISKSKDLIDNSDGFYNTFVNDEVSWIAEKPVLSQLQSL